MAQLLNDGVVALRAIEPTDLDVLTSWENDTSLWELGCTLAPYSRKRLWDYIENIHSPSTSACSDGSCKWHSCRHS